MSILPKRLLTFFVLTAAPVFLLAQGYSYAHYDVKDGLAGTTVYRMAQDKDGFMWFATETGLSRFDGTHFVNFTMRDGLPANEITQVFVDSRNRVWCTPFNKGIAYYWKGKIFNDTNDPVLAKLQLRSTVISVSEDSAGDIFLNQTDILAIIHPDHSIAYINRVEGEDMRGMTVGVNKKGGARIEAGLARYAFRLADIQGDSAMVIKDLGQIEISNPITTYIGPRLEVFGLHDSLLFMDPAGDHQFKIRSPEGFISISPIDDTLLTLNSYTYTYLFDLHEKKITDSFLQGEMVDDVLRDTEGDLWFSTLNKGVYRLGSAQIRNYAITDKNNNLAVASIYGSDSMIYAGCDRFHLFMIGKDGRTIRNLRITGEVSRGRVTAILKNKIGQILLGTDDGRFISDGQGFKRFGFPEAFAIKSYYPFRDSLVLESSNLGIRILSASPFKYLSDWWIGRVTCALYNGGKIYAGTLNGLYLADDQKKRTFLGTLDRALTNRISGMAVSPDGTVWIATFGSGLVGYRDGRIVARIGRDQGLTSDICTCIFIHGSDLWVGTDKGLNKISPSGKDYRVMPYTSGDGLNSDIINTVYVRANEVFVGTPEGLNAFDETKLSVRSECRLQITGISNSERQWPADTSHFSISHEHNDIQFDYAGISFKSAGHIIYQYRLLGLNDEWKTTTQTTLAYPSLPSGKYEFQLQAINKYGIRSSMTSTDFVIEKSFLENWWVRVAGLILIVSVITLIFAYRVRLIRKRESEKSETISRMAELEHMALRSQMNPHFIFNCLNSIQDYVMKRDVVGVNEFIANFSKLIRLTLDQSARSSISLSEEITYISTYLELEKRRFEDKFDFEVMLAGGMDPDEYQIPPMMLQPYAENAVRHGINNRRDHLGKIRIEFSVEAGYLVCRVRDNGVGRKESGRRKGKYAIEYQSKGMSLTAKRVEMFNRSNQFPALIEIRDLENAAGAALGTMIVLRFPLNDVRVN